MKISGNLSVLKVSVMIPIVLFAVLAPFSLLLGWNLLTMFIFWLIAIPAVAIYLPIKLSANKNHLSESLLGLGLFYGLMVFMIYDLYQTDYFKIMIVSGVVNALVITAISIIRQRNRVAATS